MHAMMLINGKLEVWPIMTLYVQFALVYDASQCQKGTCWHPHTRLHGINPESHNINCHVSYGKSASASQKPTHGKEMNKSYATI